MASTVVYKFNPNKILGLLAEQRRTQKELASYMGVSENTLREKLHDRIDFKDSEICSAASFLNAAPSIFFELILGDTPNK
ncbi:MAG: DUF739 family protein [Bacteroidales bacterium]|jgi:transcriptional regulator with XRE-family HTH domain|nr:DUF739 family protein [Bacteroidales bacterium]